MTSQAPVRATFWPAEAVLAVSTSTFAACAERGRRLSRWPTRRAPRHVVPNIAPSAGSRHQPLSAGAPLVASGDRLCPQKSPAWFVGAVARLRARRPGLRAVWLGDGPATERAALAASGVEVSGWLPRGQVRELLATADLCLYSALWDGFPLMVAEAAALGVPTLVRPVPSFDNIPCNLIVDDAIAVAVAVLDNPAVSAEDVAGWTRLLQRNTTPGQRAALAEVKRGQLG